MVYSLRAPAWGPREPPGVEISADTADTITATDVHRIMHCQAKGLAEFAGRTRSKQNDPPAAEAVDAQTTDASEEDSTAGERAETSRVASEPVRQKGRLGAQE